MESEHKTRDYTIEVKNMKEEETLDELYAAYEAEFFDEMMSIYAGS